MIAITENKRKELEDKIIELEKERKEHENIESGMFDSIWAAKTTQTIDLLREILLEATVIPVEPDWYHVHFVLDDVGFELNKEYPNGVIIIQK